MSDHVIVRMRRQDYEHIKALGVPVTEVTPHREFAGGETMGVDVQASNEVIYRECTRRDVEHRIATKKPSVIP